MAGDSRLMGDYGSIDYIAHEAQNEATNVLPDTDSCQLWPLFVWRRRKRKIMRLFCAPPMSDALSMVLAGQLMFYYEINVARKGDRPGERRQMDSPSTIPISPRE
uniref:Small integral membrane protein 19 n=1 Tax=Vombatus ursinus TaxID=29139 RepID=A0A4X2MDG7_VOMUR